MFKQFLLMVKDALVLVKEGYKNTVTRRTEYHSLYGSYGGKPWVSSHPRLRPGTQKEWEEQDEINRNARNLAAEQSGYTP